MVPINHGEALKILSGHVAMHIAPGIRLIKGSVFSGAVHIVKDRTAFVSLYEDGAFSLDVGELLEHEVQGTVGHFLSHLAGRPVEVAKGADGQFRYSRRDVEYPIVPGQKIYL